MSQPRVAISAALGLAVLGAGMASFLLAGSSTSEAPRVDPSPSQATLAQPTPRATVVEAPTPPPSTKPKLPANPKLDREASDRMREQINQSLGQPSGSVASRSADPASPRDDEEAAPSELPALDKDYIRKRIQEDLVPVAVECYESALEDNPALAGKVVMSFAIVGDPDVGGVVDEAAVVAEQSTLDNEFMRECMRESLMAVSFEAPADGGRVEVTYPFQFDPGEDE